MPKVCAWIMDAAILPKRLEQLGSYLPQPLFHPLGCFLASTAFIDPQADDCPPVRSS
jgi:hypothetical protein